MPEVRKPNPQTPLDEPHTSPLDEYGSGYDRKLPSGRWQALFPDGRGAHKSLGTYATKEESERTRASACVAATDHVLAGTESLAEYGERAILAMHKMAKRLGRDLSGKEKDNNLSRWRCWIVEHMPAAKDPVECLDVDDIKAFYADLLECETDREELISNGTMKQIGILLRKVLQHAVDEDKILAANPAQGVKVQERAGDPRKEPNPLTLDELRQVLICPTYTAAQRAAISLVPFTGLRQGELAALEWSDVHNLFDGQGQCACRIAATRPRGPHIVVSRSWSKATTKSGTSRIVWLLQPATQILRAWHAHPDRIRSKYVWGVLHARGYDWGWAQKIDRYHGICYIGARREAGILRRVTFHHLRDTYASHLISGTFGRRWSIAEVADQLGHSATYVTERYAGMLDDSMELAVIETPGIAIPTVGAAAVAKTPHATPHGDLPRPAQVIEIIQHAQRDSNPRLSDPKNETRSTISSGYSPRAVSVQGVAPELASQAGELLARFAGARRGMTDAAAAELEAAALSLAAAVLDSEAVQLAGRVADNDRLMLTHAIELARVLTQHAPTDTTLPVRVRMHTGQSGRLIGR